MAHAHASPGHDHDRHDHDPHPTPKPARSGARPGPEAHGHHGHGHGAHGHAHHHAHGVSARRLTGALALTASFMFLEAAVGWASGSLALLADAGHMLADTAALGLAVAAQRLAARERTRAQTYGYRRAEVLAAFANGIVLVVTALGIFVEGVERWQAPVPVRGAAVLGTAAAGLAVNLAAAWILARGGEGKNVNTRAALAHVLSDAVGSVGAIAAGGLVQAGVVRADAAVAIGIGGLIVVGAYRLIRDTARVLMEGSPSGLATAAVEATLRATEGVEGFHDLHVWTISDGFDVLTAHVVVAPGADPIAVVQRVCDRLRDEHGLAHATIQPEASREPPLVPLRRSRES